MVDLDSVSVSLERHHECDTPCSFVFVDGVVRSLEGFERKLLNICFGSNVVYNRIVTLSLHSLQLVHKFDGVILAFFVC